MMSRSASRSSPISAAIRSSTGSNAVPRFEPSVRFASSSPTVEPA